MILGFLEILFLIGVFFACISDLRRREIDNWFNFFLLASGAAYILFSAINNWWLIVTGIVGFVAVFLLANIFYYGRVFAGGDAKLLIAMFSLFVASTIYGTLENIGFFLIFLLVGGAVYGFLSMIYFSVKNAKAVWTKYNFILVVLSILLAYLGFFVNLWFLVVFLFLFVILLFSIGKSIEKNIMIKEIPASKLTEGDWIVSTIKFRGKTIKPNWEGLTKQQVAFLRSYKKKVKVKDGLAFAPAFMLALILWIFRTSILGWFLALG